MARLADRVAIVTGAASGIGLASAMLFAEEGAKVLAVDRPGTNLIFGHPMIRSLEQDVAADQAPTTMVDAALEAFGKLDIVFNNAGVASNTLAAETDDAEWDRLQSINLRAAFRLCRQAIPHLVTSNQGRIICTSSVMAQGTDYGLAAYCASKAGLLGLTRTLALELGKHGVTVNAVLPGAIWTGMTDASFTNPHHAETWARKSALRRLGQPIDVARLALFLASEDAGFITGQAIAADGGLTLRI